MTQEVGKSQDPVLLIVLCNFLWLSNTLKQGQDDLLEDIMMFNLSLDDECNRGKVVVAFRLIFCVICVFASNIAIILIDLLLRVVESLNLLGYRLLGILDYNYIAITYRLLFDHARYSWQV